MIDGSERGVRAAILGGVSWNTMIYLDRFPEPEPNTIFARRSHRTVGSSGAGKALNLAALGVDTTLWGLLGDDEEGERVRSSLADAGVDFIAQLDRAGTMRHVNLMDAAGDRISIFENPGTLDIVPERATVARMVEDADLVAITILEHCRPLLDVVADAGKDRWIDIHDYDGKNPYHGDFIDAATHLFVSTVALPAWRGFAEARVAAGAQVVVCTHGADGASGITAADGWMDIDAVPVESVVDSNGAGDAFFAGFGVSWLAHADLGAALDAGAEQAARALRSPDLAPIRRADR